MNSDLLALFFTIALAVVVPAVLLWLTANFGPRRVVQAKLEPYEAGIAQTVGSARERFSVKFYLIAILFILFDVEAVFMFPWAVDFREMGMTGFVEMFQFIGVLMVGYLYIVGRGALKWD